jgi:hypothetical protein
MNTKEYQEIWQQIMPEADLKEVQKLIESMTVRDIMMQLILYNVFLALPASLLAALPVKRGVENKD